MQLQVSFMTLLAGIFVVLSTTHDAVNALPLSKKENSGIVTLPLKRVAIPRDVHPQILLQQQINRSRRRIARMTGRDEPSHEELELHLKRRVLSVEGPEGLEKRYNRQGVPKTQSKTSSTKTNNNKKVNGGLKGLTGALTGAGNGQQGNGGGRQGGNTTSGKGAKGTSKGGKGASAAGAGAAGAASAGVAGAGAGGAGAGGWAGPVPGHAYASVLNGGRN